MIEAKDIHYEYNNRGYMMFYKGKPIGGAGISREAKGCRSNLKLFRDSAENTKRAILAGRIDAFMREEIVKIDERYRNEDDSNDNPNKSI